MPLDVAHPIRLLDHAVGIDQVGASLRPLRHRLDRRAFRLVQFPHDVVRIREQAERETVFLGEATVVLDGVEGRAEDLGAELCELGGSITEPLALARSAGGECFWEPPEHDPSPAKVRERDGLAVLIREREVGRGRTFREHARSLGQYASGVIEVTEWARDILTRSQAAVRRFNPETVIRLVKTSTGVEARLAEHSEDGDQEVEAGDATVFAEAGLEGVIDIEEPHDRIVLKPPGSPANDRGQH